MKKFWAVLLTVIMLSAVLAGCGSSKKEPADLSGKWEAEHEEGVASYMTADIGAENIKVYFYTPNGDTTALYWSGTYTAPTEPTKDGSEYTWTSQANHDEMDKALMASQDDSKEFTYKNEELSFPISMMGVQTTIHMHRLDQTEQAASSANSKVSSQDSSQNDAASEVSTDPETADDSAEFSEESSATASSVVPSINTDVNDATLDLGRSGFFVHDNQYSDSYYIEYASELTNNGKNYAVEFPKLQITFEDGSGNVIATDTQTGFYVMPGDTIALSSQIEVPKDAIDDDTTYSFSTDGDTVKATSLDIPKASDFTFANVNETSSSSGTKITGKVSYSSGQLSREMIALTALAFKGDTVVGIATTYIDAPAPGQETAFQIEAYDTFPDHDSLQVYAQVW